MGRCIHFTTRRPMANGQTQFSITRSIRHSRSQHFRVSLCSSFIQYPLPYKKTYISTSFSLPSILIHIHNFHQAFISLILFNSLSEFFDINHPL